MQYGEHPTELILYYYTVGLIAHQSFANRQVSLRCGQHKGAAFIYFYGDFGKCDPISIILSLLRLRRTKKELV